MVHYESHLSAHQERRRSHSKPRVLLADDDFELRQTVAEVLRSRGYVVETVGTGIGLLDRLSDALLEGRAVPTDAIVTDVRMPGCSGLNIVKGLRGSGWDLPIVIISAFADDSMRATVRQLDNVTLLEKPFSDVELDRTLRRALAR